MKLNANVITTILGAVSAIAIAGQQAIAAYNGGTVNWLNVAGAVVIALFGYFTNKPQKTA
jgi:hypothetical protein